MNTDLHKFEGRTVKTTTIRVTNAGDGLSEALEIDPLELAIGERVYVVLECDVSKIRHEPVKADKGDDVDLLGDVQRVQFLKAGAATIVGKDLVLDLVNTQKDRIAQVREEAEGVQRLKLEQEAAEREALEDDEDVD